MKKILLLLLFAFGTSTPAWAAPNPQHIMFGINEGVASQQSFQALQDKYKGLSNIISEATQRPVRVEASQSFKSSETNLEKSRYDFMFVRPSNVAGVALRDNKYTLVAAAKGDFAAAFIVNKNSPLKKPDDIRGKRIGMSAPKSLMAEVGLATMRDMGMDPAKEQIQYARLQEVVAYMVEQNFVDVAVVAPPVAKQWEAKGNPVLFRSKPLPFWCLIASPNVPAEDVAKVRTALLALEGSPQGQELLAKIGVKGFTAGDPQAYLDLVKWLRE